MLQRNQKRLPSGSLFCLFHLYRYLCRFQSFGLHRQRHLARFILGLDDGKRFASEGGRMKRTEGLHVVGMTCSSHHLCLACKRDFYWNLSSGAKMSLLIFYLYMYIREVVVRRGNAVAIGLQHDACRRKGCDELQRVGLCLLGLWNRHCLE